MPTYISAADTAKMVRKALKESFAGIKFSVRTSTYAGGASISVGWTDGPTDSMVRSVTGTFSGSYFDSSIDYQGSTKAMIDGVVVQFGANSVSTRREMSAPFLRASLAIAERRYGSLVAGVSVTESKFGAHLTADDYDACRYADEVAHKRTTYMTARKSKTAGKVIYLGNDGYSQTGALQDQE